MPKESKTKKKVVVDNEEIIDLEMQKYVNHIGLAIVYYRRLRKLTQAELGEQSYLATNYIGQIERGERCPSLTTLIKIANALDTSGSKILADAEQKLDEE